MKSRNDDACGEQPDDGGQEREHARRGLASVALRFALQFGRQRHEVVTQRRRHMGEYRVGRIRNGRLRVAHERRRFFDEGLRVTDERRRDGRDAETDEPRDREVDEQDRRHQRHVRVQTSDRGVDHIRKKHSADEDDRDRWNASDEHQDRPEQRATERNEREDFERVRDALFD